MSSNRETGALYIVATPIGNLADLSARAITTLKSVDLIAAEDTRHSSHLLQHYAINTPTLSLHQHNEQQKSQQLLTVLQQGRDVALISDAGTPLISDPGYRLVSLVRQQDIQILTIPGACAAIAALSISGLSSDRFIFEGFLPAKQSHRKKRLALLGDETATLIFYESPRRILATLTDIEASWGGQRQACLARELTKLHETVLSCTISELVIKIAEDSNQQRGECVLLVEGAIHESAVDQQELERVLNILLSELPVKAAAATAAKLLGIPKNDAYRSALELKS